MNKYNISLVNILLFVIVSSALFAQRGFDSPYECMYNHLNYLQADNYFPNQSALSLYPQGDSSTVVERAIALKQILDGRGLFVYMSKIPTDSMYRDTTTDKFLYYPFPEELPEVYITRSDEGWLYDAETVEAIPRLHRQTYPWGTDRLIKYFPTTGANKILGMTTWQLMGILILIILIVLLHFILQKVWIPVFYRLGKVFFKSGLQDEKLIRSMSKYLSLLVVFFLLKALLPILQLPIQLMAYTVRSIRIVMTLLGAILFFRVIDWVLKYLEDLTQKTESKMDDQLMPIISKVFKILIIFIAIFQILKIFDINVTALIAGISIGGLALALAAQDTVKNLIGSVMIFIDQPFQIGDYIEVGGVAGTVREVGFRSTRIMAKDTSIIAIPNSTMSNASVTNKGVRTFRLFETTLGVTYDTKPEKIEAFIEGLKQIILSHEKVHPEDYYVHFVLMDASSLNILFRAYLKVNTYQEELTIVQELHLSILRLAEDMGVQFAFPSRSVYVESMPGKD